MRVAHVIDTLGPGGAERLLVTNLRHLDRVGLEHRVIAVYDHDDHWRGELDALGIAVGGLHARNLLDAPRAVLRLRRLLIDDGIALVHTHLQAGNLVGRVAGRLAGIAVVSSIHNPDHEPEVWRAEGFRHPCRQRVLRALDGLTARRCTDHLVAVSAYVAGCAHRALRFPLARTTVVPNPVELAGDQAGPGDALPVPPGARIALSVARVVPQKGLLELVDAVARTDPRHDLHLVVAGSTANAAHVTVVRTEAARRGIAERVHLVGPRRDVPTLLEAADVFVLSSRYEGFGIALAEAMAAGRPCVVSDIPAFEELVDDGRTGLLAGSAETMAAGIERVLDDPAFAARLGSAAADDVLHRLDPQLLADRLADLYREVLERRANRPRQ